MPECPVNNIRLGATTVGLFVGVSDYGEEAKLWSTPAHSIGAALFRAPFVFALRNAQLHSTRVGESRDTIQAKLTLLADLRVDPTTSLGASTIHMLKKIDAIKMQIRGVEYGTDEPIEPGPQPYLGDGEPVTRSRIMSALHDTIENAQFLPVDTNLIFLLYISAHGWIGPDGKPYLLPADADYDDPNTWIAYEDLVNPIADLLLDLEFEHPTLLDAEKASPIAILVLDTCQTPRPDAPPLPKDLDLQGPPGIFLVQTTSPGQYAWHWSNATRVVGETTAHREVRFGFPKFPPRAKRGPIDEEFSSTMSAFPLASLCALSEFSQSSGDASSDREPAEGSVIEDMVQNKTNEDQIFSVLDWLGYTGGALDQLISQIPEVKESGMGQEMQVYGSSSDDAVLNTPVVKYFTKEATEGSPLQDQATAP
jgi:hypothetical protein